MTSDARTSVLVVVEQLRRRAPGGIGTYARGLLQGLAELDSATSDTAAQADPPRPPSVELLAARWDRRGGPARDPLTELGFPLRPSVLSDPVLTRAWRAGVVRAPTGFDVVHATSLAFPRPRPRAGLVVVVHDLLWRRVPEAYPRRGRDWHEAALQRALRVADRFVVPAEVVGRDLVGAGADESCVSVVPMGSDHLPPPDDAGRDGLLARLGVDGPYIVSVGTVEPRKNLDRLVAAFEKIRGSLPGQWPLVVVGPSGWGDGPPPAPGVVQTGAVSAGVLSALYSGATLLAYVPLVEGFGLPPVEAMAVGTPVVASSLPSTQGAALDVDPYDVDSIAEGLLAAATDDGVRTRLRAAGLDRAAELQWARIARQHVDIWERVADHAGAPHR